MEKLMLPSGRTLSDVITGVTVKDRTTERTDTVFMAAQLRDLYDQSPVGSVYIDDCDCEHVSWTAAFELVDGAEVFAAPVPPKPTPIEVTDELLNHLYDHDHEDEWCGHDVCGQSLRRIVQRAFKYVGLEVKS